jgi:hypothetical protein
MRVNVNANGQVYGQVSVEDPAEADKGVLYHEPYNLNKYSSGQGGGRSQQSKELQQRHPSSPDYTGESTHYTA